MRQRPELLDINPGSDGVPRTLKAVHKALFASRARVRAGELASEHYLVEGRLRELVMATTSKTPQADYEALAKTLYACGRIFGQVAERTSSKQTRMVAYANGAHLAELATHMAPEGSPLQKKLEQKLGRDFPRSPFAAP